MTIFHQVADKERHDFSQHMNSFILHDNNCSLRHKMLMKLITIFSVVPDCTWLPWAWASSGFRRFHLKYCALGVYIYNWSTTIGNQAHDIAYLEVDSQLLGLWVQCPTTSTSLIWHIWDTRKWLYYRGLAYSIIWQFEPLCHNNEVLHENTHSIFSHMYNFLPF